ncbi:DNA starvation/stationary phase protection protein Dps [Corynebacterium caspium]|uniref:DNA starvation/stationary phase protection protein Dps n=1 Tax=Corynebacterium caspium TaxID=234828 RepID=UPI000367E672|nr:DNA starvation/stationary phase protection protein Dps [Corynebacterium caspium]WKD60035.1 DNA protection during starvation protein [Corynebacterium caspium DSM 44850]
MSNFTVPGINENDAKKLIDGLQERLSDFNDLHLILKHAHWNVTGPSFISVHEMLDPQVELVRGFADEIAERIATLGGDPIGTPGGHADGRTPLQYDLGKADTQVHLKALDELYVQVIESLRESMAEAGELDPVTEDMYIGEAAELEKFQWFMRAHLEG